MLKIGKLILLGLLLASNAVSARTAALVTDVSGAVKRVGGELSILDRLEEGDQLRLGPGARATLAFTGKGTHVKLSGPCAVAVEAGGVRLVEGAAASVTVQEPGKRGAVAVPEGVNLSRGAFVRREPLLALLNDPVVPDGVPVLSWKLGQDFEQIGLAVEDKRTAVRVLEVTLPGSATSFAIPPQNALEPGGVYEVQLEGVKNHRWSSYDYDLTVLEAAQAEQVRQAEAYYGAQLEADPEDVSAMTGLLAVYADHELFTPALKLAESASKRRPSDPNLTRIRDELRRIRLEAAGGQ